MRDEFKFEVSIGGENYIDAVTFANILNGFSNLSNIVAREQGYVENVGLVVNDTKRGSFVIEFLSQINIDPTIFNMENLQYAKMTLEVIIMFFTIKAHLKGSTPNSIEHKGSEIVIENMQNGKITVNKNIYNVYAKDGNREIAKMMTNYDRGELSILYEDEKKLSVGVDEVDYMKSQVEVEPVEEYREIVSTCDQWLRVKKADFIGNSKWEFVLKRNKSTKTISATIEDDSFMQGVKNGNVNINARTSILAKMEVLTRLNEINESIYDKYSILEVIRIEMSQTHTQLEI